MKRIIFAKIMLLALLATAGCNTEGGSGQGNEDGDQYLGEWKDPEVTDCQGCGRWVLSRTKEGGIWAVYHKHGGGGVAEFPAQYDPTSKMLLIETGGGLKASLVNGALKMRSQTYNRVGDGQKSPH